MRGPGTIRSARTAAARAATSPQAQAARSAHTRVYPIGALTAGREGKELAEIGLMVRAGAIAFSDPGGSTQRSRARPVIDVRRALAGAAALTVVHPAAAAALLTAFVGACAMAPVMIVGEKYWGNAKAARMKKYLAEGGADEN